MTTISFGPKICILWGCIISHSRDLDEINPQVQFGFPDGVSVGITEGTIKNGYSDSKLLGV